MPTSTPPAPNRLGSIDAYRGAVMLLMMAEVLNFRAMAESLPANPLWRFLANCQTHVAWTGCSLHDLIQPSFSFLVGVALPFSIASRTARGQSPTRMLGHAAWRSIALIALGVGLRYWLRPHTRITIEDTLTQIGLGYVPLFLLGWARSSIRWTTLIAILAGDWALFALWPAPGPDFDWQAVGVPVDWPHHFNGLAAHWNKNSNAAWAFDTWFLNLFPRATPFTHNVGGYATLNFVPTLGTMILGLFAGTWLMSDSTPRSKVGRLLIAGSTTLGFGLLIEAAGVCPSVKRIWTPTWVLVSGGACFLILSGFYSVIDWVGVRAWAIPLRVVGVNSIAAYVLAEIAGKFVVDWLSDHATGAFALLGPEYNPLLIGIVVLTAEWLLLYWLYRRQIYLKL